jgi:hypothetical protein
LCSACGAIQPFRIIGFGVKQLVDNVPHTAVLVSGITHTV